MSRILVRSGAALDAGYIDPEPSGQCHGKRRGTSTADVHIPVMERSILGPKSTTSGARDARNTPANSKEKRRCTERHEETCENDVRNRSNRIPVLEAVQHAVRQDSQTDCRSKNW